jgi:hypothetical protein
MSVGVWSFGAGAAPIRAAARKTIDAFMRAMNQIRHSRESGNPASF